MSGHHHTPALRVRACVRAMYMGVSGSVGVLWCTCIDKGTASGYQSSSFMCETNCFCWLAFELVGILLSLCHLAVGAPGL